MAVRQRTPTYRIYKQSILCLVCRWRSYSPSDIRHRYCVKCHVFQDERGKPKRTLHKRRLHDDKEDPRERLARASGEPLVTGLPKNYKGQLTITVGGCWRRHGDGRPIYRKLFAALRGPIVPGKLLHHRCENGGSCSNPWHTEPMTTEEHKAEHADLKFLLVVSGVGRGVGRRDVAY
jgi:hypothetical protein